LRVEAHTLDRYTWKTANYPRMLIDISESINRKAVTLQSATRAQLARHTQHLAALERTADVLSPQRTLERGYAVLLAKDHAIRSVKELNAQSQVRAVLADGETELLLTRQGSLL
jgi:exodeoxyribonuclease VII large subunit